MVDGQKFDEGKTRLDLIPPELVWGVGKVLTFGAGKYGDRNWERGIKYSRVFGAALRHLFAWWGGERFDKESGLHHLWHAACCVAFLIAYEQRGMTAWDNRPIPIVTYGEDDSVGKKMLRDAQVRWQGYEQSHEWDVLTGRPHGTTADPGQCDPRPNGGAA